MASIAYITDHKMIEFHRLHGNTTFIFWRPTSQKRFSYFTYGDFLFFLAKGTEKGKKREKGIVGYGKFTKEYIIAFEEMWRRFKTLTGYASKEDLYEAIIKVAKNQQLPEKLHCLKLEQVVFFQTPIYLSELEIAISKQVESYIYLDQDDITISSNIIKKGASYGQDMWSAMVSDKKVPLEYDALLAILQNIHALYTTSPYTAYEKAKISSFSKLYMQNDDGAFITPGYDDFYLLNKERMEIYLPCIVSMLSFDRNLLYCIGKYQCYLSGTQMIHQNIKIYILFDEPIDSKWRILLETNAIPYKIHAY